MKFIIDFNQSNDLKQSEHFLVESIRSAFNAKHVSTVLPSSNFKKKIPDTIVVFENNVCFYNTKNYIKSCCDIKTAYLEGGSVELEMMLISQKTTSISLDQIRNHGSKLIRTNKGVENFELNLRESKLFDTKKLSLAEFEEVWECPDKSIRFSYLDSKLNFIITSPKYIINT